MYGHDGASNNVAPNRHWFYSEQHCCWPIMTIHWVFPATLFPATMLPSVCWALVTLSNVHWLAIYAVTVHVQTSRNEKLCTAYAHALAMARARQDMWVCIPSVRPLEIRV